MKPNILKMQVCMARGQDDRIWYRALVVAVPNQHTGPYVDYSLYVEFYSCNRQTEKSVV